ncbi:MAG: hypothetical protein QM775_21385 [Pirellulales bacterium]
MIGFLPGAVKPIGNVGKTAYDKRETTRPDEFLARRAGVLECHLLD